MTSLILSLFVLVSPVFADEGEHHSHPAPAAANAKEFGDISKVSTKPVKLETLVGDYEKYKAQTVVTNGTVKKVCEKMGCWFVLEEGKTQVRTLMKDNGFSVPKELVGKKVAMVGQIERKELPAKVLRHYLKDEGKTDAEIEKMKINAPQTVYMFEAVGVRII